MFSVMPAPERGRLQKGIHRKTHVCGCLRARTPPSDLSKGIHREALKGRGLSGKCCHTTQKGLGADFVQ